MKGWKNAEMAMENANGEGVVSIPSICDNEFFVSQEIAGGNFAILGKCGNISVLPGHMLKFHVKK